MEKVAVSDRMRETGIGLTEKGAVKSNMHLNSTVRIIENGVIVIGCYRFTPGCLTIA